MVFLLCCLAAIHVFIFSAAFPFFNAADEWAHFDLVVKYSEGHIPPVQKAVSTGALPYLVIFSTQECLWPSNNFPAAKFPPFWTQPPEKAAPVIWYQEQSLKKVKNFETSQPPLYYLLAGLWWRLGKVCGLQDGWRLYSVRFLNCFFVAALVWLGFMAAKLVFPGQPFLRLGVPALLAFMPQVTFFSIQNDVLSPVCFGAAFIGLIYFLRAEIPSPRLGAAAGLALTATFLTKLANLPLLAVSGIVVLLKLYQLVKSGKLRAALPALLNLVLCAGLPAIGWLAWHKIVAGNLIGTAAKIHFLGWTYKPFSQWWHHPIFTPHGLWTFFSGLMATFWQGQFLWHRRPLAWPAVNIIYTVLSLGCIGMAVTALLPRFTTASRPQRQALWLGFGCCAAAVGFLGFLSIIYDFHDCFYPSRAHPYFDSGRLMLGALIPFLLLFTFGLDRALHRFGHRTKYLGLAALILFMLATEIMTDWPVFPNPYNWFHL